MSRVNWIILIAITLSLIFIGGYIYLKPLFKPLLVMTDQPLMTKEDVERARALAAQQNEDAFLQWEFQKEKYKKKNELKNVYFGDLHVHSSLSFDAYIFNTRLDVDESYEFAKGMPFKNMYGETMQISRPLDFAAVTDHAETFGIHESCSDPDITEESVYTCQRLETPSFKFFAELRETAVKRPPVSFLTEAINDKEKEEKFIKSTWNKIINAAERHNDPGKFTTFIAYEYSPVLPDGGYNHRNVIFKNNTVPDRVFSLFDAHTAIDLWEKLLASCNYPCEFMTIPHNSNRSWGVTFADKTIDGAEYTEANWAIRDKVEPLVEMFQIKGNSECSTFFGSTDEECNIEQIYPKCEKEGDTLCIQPTSMVRDALKRGIELETDLGFNPLDLGVIGSSDTHNANPGDTEEWDFKGESSVVGPAFARTDAHAFIPRFVNNPGGLAAIWAKENNRDELFEAMQNKEVYATTGTRIELRFFGGFDYNESILSASDPLTSAYNDGNPMGSTIKHNEGKNISFYITAKKDPIDAPLDKIQVIKGWIENGEAMEEVMDVVCSENRKINNKSMRCETLKVDVDLTTCKIDQDRGADELKVLWTDPNYKPEQNAFYYARVLQNPTCRWTTYDNIRAGRKPPKEYSATMTEMAWSSPIWIRD